MCTMNIKIKSNLNEENTIEINGCTPTQSKWKLNNNLNHEIRGYNVAKHMWHIPRTIC